MKILMLCEFYNEKMEYQENLLAKYYLKHGHAVTIITSTFESVFDYYNDRHDNSKPARTYNDRGARIIKLPYRYNILNRLRAYTRIDGILESEAPDLIYVHDIMPNFPEVVRYKRRHPDCRMIMDYHADYSNSGKNWISLKILHGILRKWFLDRARPHLSGIFAFTPAAIPFLHENYQVPIEDIELLPLGADLDLCAEIKAAREGEKLRRALGIADDAIVIFTGGKLEPWKRTELLIEAVKGLESLPLQLIVVGDSGQKFLDYKNSLVEAARGHSNVRFVGWRDSREIYKYLDMADIAVFPASQSILWQQAIAMGLPLIVGNTGNQDISYLNLRHNIVILDKYEIRTERLMQEIKRIATDPERLRAMSVGAAEVADDHLNWDKLIQRTLRFNRLSNDTSEQVRK
jgi:1,2-diacylglycerol 3-alpha-glucosyltransferase